MKKWRERPMELTPLKGKVDLKWYGHAGWKINFMGKHGEDFSMYLDMFI